MGRRSALWNRLFTRLHHNRSAFSTSQDNNRSYFGNHCLPLCTVPPRYSLALQDVRSESLPQRSGHSDHNVQLCFVPSQFQRNFRTCTSYVPKCLKGLDFDMLLQGSTSYDDFSHSCWLENHLHRFGGLDASINNDHNNLHNVIENSSFWNSNFEDISDTNTTISSGSTLSLFNNFDALLGQDSRDSTISIRTVSDITQFYGSMNLSDASLNQNTNVPMEAPPPYTECHDDPPPPYTESLFTPPGRNPTNTSARASIQLNEQAVLW